MKRVSVESPNLQGKGRVMNRELEIGLEAAWGAGRLVKEMQSDVKVSEKAKNNLVTSADLAAEESIISTISKHFPSHSFCAEERHESTPREADNLWVIDPLDGTNNYAHGIPHFSVSIAYAQRGEVLTGVVFDPMRDECYTAVKGEGAFLNGNRIAVSSCDRLDQSIIATGFAYDRARIMERTLDAVHGLFKRNIRGIRRMGSAALDMCWVACGRFDGYFEHQLAVWDYAAGMLILREAGGVCDNGAGNPLALTATSIAVSNGKIHKEFLDVVRWRGQD
jgi:myo-inositol-1(or 4)-monophosphatase